MHYLYLDESGDLGDPQTPGASRHLVITVLDVEGATARKLIEKSVERTLKNKVNPCKLLISSRGASVENMSKGICGGMACFRGKSCMSKCIP